MIEKDLIHISLTDGTSAVIFTRHIVYMTPSENGTTIALNAGGQTVNVVTKFKVDELLKMITEKP